MEKNNMPAELAKMLDSFESLVACGGIRSFYDGELAKEYPDTGYKYTDSKTIFNLFSLLEDLAGILLDGDIKGAEDYIKEYFNGEWF